MLRRTLVTLTALLGAGLTGAAMTAGPATADSTPPEGPGTAGPPYRYTTELVGQFHFVPLTDQAMLTRTEHGYRFRAGQQNSHLTVTVTDDGLRFHDRGTKRWKKLAAACEKRRVDRGIAAVCRVPAGISTDQPLLVEVWPRLGNDFVDLSALPATFASTVLADRGRDVALFGAGWDFFNGHTGRDRVRGGAGYEWIRSGDGNDVVYGGAGDDQIVAMDGHDTVYGEDGDDRLGGSSGRDRMRGGSGADFFLCDTGVDTIWVDRSDRHLACERIKRP